MHETSSRVANASTICIAYYNSAAKAFRPIVYGCNLGVTMMAMDKTI